MTSPGVELATEWVTILPETAQLVKELKKFKPPPIQIEFEVAKEAKQAAATFDKAMVSATKKTGDKVAENVVPSANQVKKPAERAGAAIAQSVLKPVESAQDRMADALVPTNKSGRIRSAASRVGQMIRDSVVEKSEQAGKDSMEKMARGIEKGKSAVARAERSVADARAAAANVDSRVRTQEAKVQQYRDQTIKGAKRLQAAEETLADMRANAADHTADDIAKQEARITALRDQQAARATRYNAAVESQGRLQNSQATAANRVAGAIDVLAGREAALAAQVASANDPLDQQNRRFGQGGAAAGGMMASLIPLGKQLLVTSGLFTGALGLGGAITYTLRKGNEFTDSMNKMSGILNASAADMGLLNQKARELGRDIELPATSANDAATAMLELTKAGFTMDQAMDSAKGSLQLSAAAGIEAADAAYITGTALNAYQLKAADAAKVTDLLANAANLFPGEMTDFGYSLSQAGAVANSFGISIEDTTTALGFLAKAGIKSSDAGTLIKTMLLSLTDSGKPAQEAIKELGLELYDQQGQFKGLEYVYKRLNEASKSMTQEQYQAATATLFGTDAARFAGLAAGEAAPNWDEFRSKIDETGTAARVANARLQGLPGAMEKLKNAGESLALTIYDAVSGPLENIVRKIAEVVLNLDGWLNGPAVQWFQRNKETIQEIGIALGTFVTVLAAVKVATMLWSGAIAVLNAIMYANPIGLIVVAVAALVAGVVYAYRNFETFRNVVDAAWNGIKAAAMAAWPVIKTVFNAWLTYVKFMWNSVLKPFFGWLANDAWPVVKTAFQLGWMVIKATFDAIKTAVMFVWNNVAKPAFAGIAYAWEAMSDIFQVTWRSLKAVFETIGSIITWLWKNIAVPAWNGISTAASLMWQGLQMVFGWIGEGLGLLGEGMTWLWKTIFEPAWNAIKAGFQAVWDFLQPVFDGIKGAITTVGDVASKIAQGIKSAWDGIAEVFKIPLRALGTFLASIPSNILGVEVDFVADINNWGKKLQGLRTGGMIEGPGTGTSDSILAMNSGIPVARVSDGEGIVRADALQTPLGRMLFEMLNSGSFNGLPGFAEGGLTPGAQYLKTLIHKNWPNITNIGGYRPPDGYNEHSSGNALDVMIPNYQSDEGRAQGDQVAAFALSNAGELGLTHLIWQQRLFKPGDRTGSLMPDRGSDTANHYDHVHIWTNEKGGAEPLGSSLVAGSGSIMGRNASYGGTSGGGTAGFTGGGSSGGGGYYKASTEKQISAAEDRVSDRRNQMERAQMRLDELLTKQREGGTVNESTLTNARDQVEKFTRELAQSEEELKAVRQGKWTEGDPAGKGSSDSVNGGQDWGDVGKMIFGGFLESLGLDGSVFTNLFETPNFKSAMAGVNFGMGLLNSVMNPQQQGGADQGAFHQGTGGLPGPGSDGNLGGMAGVGFDMLAGLGEPMGIQSMAPPAADAALAGTAGGGTTFDLRGSQLGVSPNAMEDKIGEMTAAGNRFQTLPKP